LRRLGSFSEADVAEDKAAIIQEEAGAVEGTMNTGPASQHKPTATLWQNSFDYSIN